MTERAADGAERIAVLRALPGLGDFLCVVPALRALRRAHPEAHIALIGLPDVRQLVARFRWYVDELLPFPGFPGIPEVELDPSRTLAFLAAAQARPFDLALQLHGSGQASNPFVALLGARTTAGFVLPGFAAPDPDRFLPYPGDQPEPLRHLQLMRFLGMPADDASLELPMLDGDRAEAERLAARHGLVPGRYACVHPGAAEAWRRWPLERFAAVADGLADRGLTPVLTGTAAERELTAAAARVLRAPAVDLAGATSLGGLAALLAGAAVTVTNDTGTSHLAAALAVPSVVVFSASDPRRWAPLDATRHRALGRPRAPARAALSARCLRDGCRGRLGDPVLDDVAVADVLCECDALLAGADALRIARNPEYPVR